ncbi:MAG: 3-phosphoglycerate dehydrogenase [Clostridiales bacterium]|jgi:D-3-phosphoglycerate dehydrogenase|nr:3-phosphoglycerate dehydrogenase [Clostridiales bacterium]
MYTILRLNEISPIAFKALGDKFSMSPDAENPVAVMVRSAAMHDLALPASVLCVARAGAGVNNIPVDAYTQKGVVVFNTPGANANAVKELVLCALLLGSRQIVPAIQWAKTLIGKGADVPKLVEKGKNAFVGPEITGKTLGVIGLGAIGARVANAAVDLGMDVLGYDPYISIDGAWNLSNFVRRETDLARLFGQCDYITLHLPYSPATKDYVNAAGFAKMKQGAVLINCSRAELVSAPDLTVALATGKLSRYITDFPTEEMLTLENVIAIPHLGASTPEAEDNCAEMAARQLVDYITEGNITNSVNFPRVFLPREGKVRVTVIHENAKSVLTKLTDTVSAEKINIANMISQAKGEYAYTILDLDDNISAATAEKLAKQEHVVKVRVIR